MKLAVIVIALLCIGSAVSIDYYIDSTNGNDNNSGSQGAPWRTIIRIFESMIGFIDEDTTYNLVSSTYEIDIFDGAFSITLNTSSSVVIKSINPSNSVITTTENRGIMILFGLPNVQTSFTLQGIEFSEDVVLFLTCEFWHVLTAELILRDCVFRNTLKFRFYGEVLIEDSQFYSSEASGVNGAHIVVSNCDFINTQFFLLDGNFEFVNSRFYDTTVPSIASMMNDQQITVSNCNFTNCSIPVIASEISYTGNITIDNIKVIGSSGGSVIGINQRGTVPNGSNSTITVKNSDFTGSTIGGAIIACRGGYNVVVLDNLPSDPNDYSDGQDCNYSFPTYSRFKSLPKISSASITIIGVVLGGTFTVVLVVFLTSIKNR